MKDKEDIKMPAFYAHDRFGEKTAEKLEEELKQIVLKYYPQFEIGLQGPDLLFFYRAYSKNRVNQYGTHLHSVSARPFFEHAVKVVKKRGRDSACYAYLLGFICHYTLDSECHPYVAEMIEKTGVQHLEIEEEFEKYLLRMDKQDPLAYRLGEMIPTDAFTAKAIAPFYPNLSTVTVQKSLKWFRFIKNLFCAPGRGKQMLINGALKLSGKNKEFKGLMHQRVDNPKCIPSNEGLFRRYQGAVSVAVRLMEDFDESVRTGAKLCERFDRTFE